MMHGVCRVITWAEPILVADYRVAESVEPHTRCYSVSQSSYSQIISAAAAIRSRVVTMPRVAWCKPDHVKQPCVNQNCSAADTPDICTGMPRHKTRKHKPGEVFSTRSAYFVSHCNTTSLTIAILWTVVTSRTPSCRASVREPELNRSTCIYHIVTCNSCFVFTCLGAPVNLPYRFP